MLKRIDGAQLQAARREAAERFQAVAKRHTPADVSVEFHKRLSGRAWPKHKRIVVPEPKTRRALHIYLHEVAHVVLNHVGKVPRHVEEMEAEKWAFAVMRQEQIPIPRKSLQSARAYVGFKIRQARRRGAKRIDPEAAKFAKS
jgi:hypothetical protein